jgi:hypothetical protein
MKRENAKLQPPLYIGAVTGRPLIHQPQIIKAPDSATLCGGPYQIGRTMQAALVIEGCFYLRSKIT